MPIRTLPNLSPGSDFYSTMKSWQQSLKPLIKSVQPPTVVLSFSAKGVSNGIQLTWGNTASGNSPITGFIIQISNTGDFSTGYTEVPVTSGQSNSYFDPQPAGTTRYYRLIAVANPFTNQVQSRSNPTGVISATVASGTTTSDSSQTGNPSKNFGGFLFPNRPRSSNFGQ